MNSSKLQVLGGDFKRELAAGTIIVSGGEELRLRRILAPHPIDGYIRKPFRIQEALHIIRNVLTNTGVKPAAH